MALQHIKFQQWINCKKTIQGNVIVPKGTQNMSCLFVFKLISVEQDDLRSCVAKPATKTSCCGGKQNCHRAVKFEQCSMMTWWKATKPTGPHYIITSQGNTNDANTMTTDQCFVLCQACAFGPKCPCVINSQSLSLSHCMLFPLISSPESQGFVPQPCQK